MNGHRTMTINDLKKYKENLYVSLSKDLAEFEKNFLLVSGGILAFSITFIKELVKIEEADYLFILYGSWFLIILSVAIIMLSFLKSSDSSDELWKLVDDFILANKTFKDDDILDETKAYKIKNDVNNVFYLCKKGLKNCRYLAVISFILGVVLLAIFVSINISHEKRKIEINKQQSLKTDSILINSSNKTIKIIIYETQRNNLQTKDYTIEAGEPSPKSSKSYATEAKTIPPKNTHTR